MNGIEALISQHGSLIIKQKKEWIEIFSGFETKNNYSITTESGEEIGYIVEEGSGFLKILRRFFFRSHRPFEITVLNKEGHRVLKLHRKFFFFFSDLHVEFEEKKYGSIHRRFSFLTKKYSILDSNDNEIFKLRSPFWKIWTFPIFNLKSQEVGVITKKWQGLIKEAFTDSDAFLIRFSKDLDVEDKILLFCSGISVDFDFFENNQGSSSLLDFLGH
jgi:uncharacterized protein YxjI